VFGSANTFKMGFKMLAIGNQLNYSLKKAS